MVIVVAAGAVVALARKRMFMRTTIIMAIITFIP